jgi:heme exporter protein B
MIALTKAIFSLVHRDLTVAGRRVHDVVLPLVFFAIVTSLFPLGVGPEPNLLSELAPGVLWVAALLATMLSLNRLFANDYADGTLELLVLAPHPLSLLVVAKVASQSRSTCPSRRSPR